MRLLDFCITQLKAQGPSRTCKESTEEEEEEEEEEDTTDRVVPCRFGSTIIFTPNSEFNFQSLQDEETILTQADRAGGSVSFNGTRHPIHRVASAEPEEIEDDEMGCSRTWLKPRPQSGLDCVMCAEFVRYTGCHQRRQRRRRSTRWTPSLSVSIYIFLSISLSLCLSLPVLRSLSLSHTHTQITGWHQRRQRRRRTTRWT